MNRLKRKFLRIKIGFSRKFKIRYTDMERNIKSLLLRLIHDPDCTIMFAPLSDHIYLNNSTAQVLIHKEKIKIVNHTYYYEINIENGFAGEMMQMVKNKVDRDRINLENKIFISKNEMLKKLILSIKGDIL